MLEVPDRRPLVKVTLRMTPSLGKRPFLETVQPADRPDLEAMGSRKIGRQEASDTFLAFFWMPITSINDLATDLKQLAKAKESSKI